MNNSFIDRAISKAIRIYDRSMIKQQDNRLPAITTEEQHLAEAFRRKLQALYISDSSGMSPAQKTWHENMRTLQQLSIASDPRNFLSWEVVGGTMFVKYARYSRVEYKYLSGLADWSRWKPALAENSTGNPVRCPFDTSTSCNLVHHAYHLAQFEDFSNSRIENFRNIFEFGGGYGSMCRLFFNLGFEGRYIIVDLPAFSILQEYYLKSIGIKVLSVDEYIDGKSGVLCISDLDTIDKLIDRNTNSLFLATWSISEAPLSVRKKILDNHSDAFDAFLIAYQPNFEDVDNSEYFEGFCKTRSDYLWQVKDMEHLKNQKYLFGKKISAQYMS